MAAALSLGTYDVGDQPKFTATFTNDAGVATDPTTVKFTTKRSGARTETVYTYPTAEISKTSTGVYVFTHPQLVAADAGQRHTVRTNGSGTCTASDEESFEVRPTAFATPLP